ncbi:MAG: SDR family oxidoreductase [Oscillospiraceae bacterium]|nr:SDR family oxidoreductase [Oscillospiraceae bacterium]
MELSNKAIVVTGASSGMGKSIVELFVKEGACVVAVARRAERLTALAEALAGEAGKIIPFVGDVSKKEDCEAMIDRCVSAFGKLDVLVNNAGVMDNMAAVGNFSDEKYDYVMGVNVYGPLAAMRKAVSVFRAQGNGGNIITVSSLGAQHPVAGVIYCAAKAAINAAVRHTAFNYAKEGIRCNAIAPGAVATEIGSAMGTPDMDGYGRIQPLVKLSPATGKGEDIASVALFLASDASGFVNGQIIGADGGWSAM